LLARDLRKIIVAATSGAAGDGVELAGVAPRWTFAVCSWHTLRVCIWPGLGSAGANFHTLPPGRAGLFPRPTRHQSMPRSSRSHAERRAQGTKQTSTIACRPGLLALPPPMLTHGFRFNGSRLWHVESALKRPLRPTLWIASSSIKMDRAFDYPDRPNPFIDRGGCHGSEDKGGDVTGDPVGSAPRVVVGSAWPPHGIRGKASLALQ
jgi:hypothetical protein